MKFIEPSVELWIEENVVDSSQHIARCARVCYGKEDKEPNLEADKKMVDGLIKRGHLSMLRHASVYSSYFNPNWSDSEFVHMELYHGSGAVDCLYSTNRQFFWEHGEIGNAPDCYDKDFGCFAAEDELSQAQVLEMCREDPRVFKVYRLTFCITTQISTSRELNRVSPNNIAERSTRYCSSKDGLEICEPWWIYGCHCYREEKVKQYEAGLKHAESAYLALVMSGMKLEDARGVLPLDTATKVIYTYTVEEWQHILDLRFYGKTGRPHPNARLVTSMVRDQINAFAKSHNIVYTV